MQDFSNIRKMKVVSADASVDQGLRSYMVGVYALMGLGLLITAISAYIIASLSIASSPVDSTQMINMGHGQALYLTDFGRALYLSPLRYLIMLAPVGVVFFLSFRINKLSTQAARGVFLGYAALVGASLSSIFLVYSQGAIAQSFMLSAASFGALSLYGYTTKRDLRPMGAFLIMAVFGLVLASLINMFMHSAGFQFGLSVLGVLIFAGLTAYDTQVIKEFYYAGDDSETVGRKIVMGALNLYLDFINLFVSLLQLVGSNRDN